ncbi:hypothetical protein N0V90_001411 [Kalmusia sp. IMI 367209]|nr:hypothetical protein N0V90_001411 [Kalmusia sp. IMI 367209]
MLLFSIILGIAATASAVDIILHNDRDCHTSDGSAIFCTNINPRMCCTSPVTQGWMGIGFYGLEKHWVTKGYRQAPPDFSPCARLIEASFSSIYRCMNSDLYMGGAIDDTFNKRSDNEPIAVEGVVEADGMLVRGKEYTLKGMEKELVEELWAHAVNGTDESDVPDIFKAFEVEAQKVEERKRRWLKG